MAVGTGFKAANYSIGGILGVDLGDNFPNTAYQTPGSAATVISGAFNYPEINVPAFALGTKVNGTNNSEWVFCIVGTASAGINQFDLCMIDQNFQVSQCTSAAAAPSTGSTFQPGFNQGPTTPASSPTASNYFLWIATKGETLFCNTASVAVNANIGLTMWVGSSPGTILGASTATTALLLGGCNNPASASAASVIGSTLTSFPIVAYRPFFTTNTGN